ncbi:MAG: transglutaminase domain-containing protein [Myxococcales bacterium]|nr:transglutaminase domain-containing protein [Myxococcales bacterium]
MLALAALTLPALADGPVVHTYFAPNPEEDLSLSATTAGGSMPAALETPSGTVQAPDPSKSPEESEVAYGGTSTPSSVDANYRIDRNTTRPEVVSYDDPFIPAVTPFKRLYAYDSVDDGLELVVNDKRLSRVSIGGNVESGDDQFYGDMVVDLAEDTAVRIPSVGPGARVLAAHTNPETRFELYRDGADNWFIKAPERKRVRLVMQLAIHRSVFGSDFADVGYRALSRWVPVLPASAGPAASEVLGKLGLSPAVSPRAAVQTLVSHFRSFTPSTAWPKGAGADLYKELALTQKGVCRHRAYAFVITALAQGIPARMVRNEAHAWVEVYDGSLWHRIDLGGAAERMDTEQDPTEPQHRPPDDPYSWPEGSESGQELAQRTLAGSGGQPEPGSGGDAGAATSVAGDGGVQQTPAPAPSTSPTSSLETDAGLMAPEVDERPASTVTLGPIERQVKRGEPLPVKGKVEADGKGCEGVRVDFKLRTPTGRMISIQSLSTVAGGAYDGAIVVPPGVDVGDYELVVSTDGNPQCGSGSSE